MTHSWNASLCMYLNGHRKGATWVPPLKNGTTYVLKSSACVALSQAKIRSCKTTGAWCTRCQFDCCLLDGYTFLYIKRGLHTIGRRFDCLENDAAASVGACCLIRILHRQLPEIEYHSGPLLIFMHSTVNNFRKLWGLERTEIDSATINHLLVWVGYRHFEFLKE